MACKKNNCTLLTLPFCSISMLHKLFIRENAFVRTLNWALLYLKHYQSNWIKKFELEIVGRCLSLLLPRQFTHLHIRNIFAHFFIVITLYTVVNHFFIIPQYKLMVLFNTLLMILLVYGKCCIVDGLNEQMRMIWDWMCQTGKYANHFEEIIL